MKNTLCVRDPNKVLVWLISVKEVVGCLINGMNCELSRGVKYHEPEHWKFGEEGNKYFRHATGQIYAISKDLATYISINWSVLAPSL